MRLHSEAGLVFARPSTAEYRETAPPTSHLGTGADTGPSAFLPQVYLRRYRILASHMSSQTALCTTLTMIASAWIPPPLLERQSFFLNWVQNTIETVPYPSSSSFDLNSVSGLFNSHSSTTRHGEHDRRRA